MTRPSRLDFPEAFTLSHDLPPTPRLPRSRPALIRALLAKPHWSDHDASRLGRVADMMARRDARYGVESEDDWELYEEANRQTREWERLKTTGNRWTVARSEREERLVARVVAARHRLEDELCPLVKPRKTYKAQKNEFDRVFGKDARWHRVHKNLKRVGRVVSINVYARLHSGGRTDPLPAWYTQSF